MQGSPPLPITLEKIKKRRSWFFFGQLEYKACIPSKINNIQVVLFALLSWSQLFFSNIYLGDQNPNSKVYILNAKKTWSILSELCLNHVIDKIL